MKFPQRLSLPFLILSAMVGLLFGLGSYTFIYAQGYSYLLDDPEACVNCHIMREQFNGWTKSSHKAFATCNSCHVPHDFIGKYRTKAQNGFWHSYYFTFQNFHEPIQMQPGSAAIVQENCLGCHSQFVSQIANHEGADEVNCIQCHRGVGHDPTQ
jgi:cytochrome c nitrite reductase small subunit